MSGRIAVCLRTMAESVWDKLRWHPSVSSILPRLPFPEKGLRCKAMHELSIAMSIVDFAREEANRRGGVHVKAVHLRLGLLSGVAKDALFSSFEMACESTSLEGSQLIVEEIPVTVFCRHCNGERPVHSIQSF